MRVYVCSCLCYPGTPVARCTRAVFLMASGTVTACWALVNWPELPPVFSLASGSRTGRQDMESTMTSPGLNNAFATSCGPPLPHERNWAFPLRLLVPARVNCVLVFPVMRRSHQVDFLSIQQIRPRKVAGGGGILHVWTKIWTVCVSGVYTSRLISSLTITFQLQFFP